MNYRKRHRPTCAAIRSCQTRQRDALRFRFATLDACLPSAVRTDLGRWAIVFFFLAALAAFLMFRLAAERCFSLAIEPSNNRIVDAQDCLSVGAAAAEKTPLILLIPQHLVDKAGGVLGKTTR